MRIGPLFPFPNRSFPVSPLTLALWMVGATTVPGCDNSGNNSGNNGGNGSGANYQEGCITVSGAEQGFAKLADAIEAADSGAIIELCEGTFQESVVIEKDLEIQGPGVGQALLSWQDHGTVLTVSGDVTVSLSGFGVTGWDDGIAVTGSSVTLADVGIYDVGGAGIRGEGASLTAQRLTVDSAGGGGLIATSESGVDLSECTFSANTGNGVTVSGSDFTAASVVVTDSRVNEENGEGGTGIYLDSLLSPSSLSGVTASGNEKAGILWYYAAVSVVDSQVEDSSAGIYGIFGGPSQVTDCAVSDVRDQGIYLMAQDSVVAGNVLSCTTGPDNQVGIAVSSQDGSLEVSDNDVSSCNGLGISVQHVWNDGYSSSGGEALVSSNRVWNIIDRGLQAHGSAVLEMTGNVVEDIHWTGSAGSDGSYHDGYAMVVEDVADAHLSGNVLDGADLRALSVEGSGFTSEGDIITRSHRMAIFVGGSTGTFRELSVTDSDYYGAWVDDASSVVFDTCTFARIAKSLSPEDWELPPDDPEFTLSGGQAVRVKDAAASILHSTFTDVEGYVLYGSLADILVEDTLFTGNGDAAIFASETDLQVGPGTVITGGGTYGIYASSGSAVIDGAIIRDIGIQKYEGGGVYIYSSAITLTNTLVENCYQNLYISNANSPETSPRPGKLEGNTFGASVSYAARVSGGGPTFQIVDNDFTCSGRCLDLNDFWGTVEGNRLAAGEHAIDLSAADTDAMAGALILSGNTLTASLSGIKADSFQGELILEGNHISGTGEEGIWIDVASNRALSLTLRDNVVEGSGILEISDGLYVYGYAGETSVVLEGNNQFIDNTGDGMDIRYSHLSASGVTLTGNAGRGLYMNGATNTLTFFDSPAVASNTSDGIYLSGTIAGDITGNIIHDNGARGIYCTGSGVVIQQCSNTMGGNVTGDTYAGSGCTLGTPEPCTVIPF